MKIAFVTTQYPPHDAGGIGSYVHSVASALARAGHEVTVVCSADGQTRSTSVEGAGVRVERFPLVGPHWLWSRWRRSEPERLRVRHALSSAWAMRQVGTFDIVEVPEWKAQGLLLSGSVVVHLHLPLEVRSRWSDGPVPARRAISFGLERVGALRADALTATSVLTATLPDGSEWPGKRTVDIVAPPIDLQSWRPVDDVSVEPRVLFVGRLETRKAPEQVIEALARLRDEAPDARAVFVGKSMRHRSGRPYRVVLEELARVHGVDCEFHDPVSDPAAMHRFYETARVVAVPSRFEPLSLVVFEALACGRPVVMSDRVGAGEWLRDFPESVVPTDDADQLAAALRPHLVDRSHAARTGAAGRALAEAVCAEDRVVETRVAVYRSVTREAHDGVRRSRRPGRRGKGTRPR